MRRFPKIVTSVIMAVSLGYAGKQYIPISLNDMIFFAVIHDTQNNLEVPTFPGNSQGKLVVQCESDIVYYIMAYDCLRQDTRPYVEASVGDVVTTEEAHVGEVFYTEGYVERDENVSVTIIGHVYSGGHVLDQTWEETCE